MYSCKYGRILDVSKKKNLNIEACDVNVALEEALTVLLTVVNRTWSLSLYSQDMLSVLLEKGCFWTAREMAL